MDKVRTMIASEKDQIIKRILILGPPGSGKTTLSMLLSQNMEVEHYAMDDLYWESGWRRPDMEKFRENLLSVLKLEQWILDGNFADIFLDLRISYADLIIILDLPPYICLFRYLKRSILEALGNNEFIPLQVRESSSRGIRIRKSLIMKILKFRSHTLLSINHKINPAHTRSIVIKNKKDLDGLRDLLNISFDNCNKIKGEKL
jgi:adenylate kinase family enzyme